MERKDLKKSLILKSLSLGCVCIEFLCLIPYILCYLGIIPNGPYKWIIIGIGVFAALASIALGYYITKSGYDSMLEEIDEESKEVDADKRR